MLADNSLTTKHATPFRNVALTNTAVSVKNAPTEIHFIQIGNTNASVVYLHIYDTASAVTVGTTTPTASYLIPTSSSIGFDMPEPLYCITACQVATSTTAAGGTAPGTAIVVNILYK